MNFSPAETLKELTETRPKTFTVETHSNSPKKTGKKTENLNKHTLTAKQR